MHKFFKITSALVLTSSLVVPTAFAEGNTVDTNAPELVSIEANRTVVAPGEDISFSIQLQDASEIKWAYLNVAPIDRNISGKTIQLKYNEQTKKYEGSYTIPTTAFNEKWYVDQVNATDIHGNYMSMSDRGYSWDNWESTIRYQIFDGIDKIAPELNGVEAIQIDAMTDFDVLKGVTATDDIDGDISKNITVSGHFDSKKEGQYVLSYSVADKAKNKTTKNRTVEVIDMTPPVFEPMKDITVYQGTSYNALADVKAIDAYDGDVTSSIVIGQNINLSKLGKQKIIYWAFDKKGNKSVAERYVTVIEKPIVTFEGIEDVAILKNSNFHPLTGVKAFEDEQNVSQSIQVTGTVNSAVEDIYEITYAVKSKSNETITATRKVHVVNSLDPYFVGVENITIPYGETFDHMKDVYAYDAMGNKLWNLSTSYGGNLKDTGNYTIQYEAKDASGRTVKATRELTIVASKPYFSDVPTTHTYFKEIQAMKERGIINGYENGTFNPTANISRQHVAALIYRSGIDLTPIRPAATFKDVPVTHTYYKEIMALYQAGIIDGSGDYFNPSGELKRAQLAKILVNAFNLEKQQEKTLSFSDMDGSWATEYVDILSSNQVTTGSNGKFMPNGTVSRMHYAAFMYRILMK